MSRLNRSCIQAFGASATQSAPAKRLDPVNKLHVAGDYDRRTYRLKGFPFSPNLRRAVLRTNTHSTPTTQGPGVQNSSATHARDIVRRSTSFNSVVGLNRKAAGRPATAPSG